MDESNRYDVELLRGVAFADYLRVEEPADTGVDLTGATATWNVYAGTPEEPGAVVVTVSTGNGRLVFRDQTQAATRGYIDRDIPAAVTATVPAGTYWQECVVTYPSGKPFRETWGYVTVWGTGVVP